MSLLDNLPHLAVAYRRSWANDTYAGTRPSETLVKSSFACWVQSASASQITEFQKRDQNVTHQILCNADPALRLEDIVIPSTGTFAAKRFTIRSFGERTSGLGWMWILYCEQDKADEPSTFTG